MEQYVLYFPTELGVEEFSIHCTEPKIKLYKTYIPYMSAQFYVSGQSYWHPIEIIVDYKISEYNTNYFLEWINLFYENQNTGSMGFATGYKKNIKINQTDPSGLIIKERIFVGSHLKKRDKKIDSIDRLELSLLFDRAFLDC